MLHGIFRLAVLHTSIASDSCVESDGISVLQNRLTDRSGQQVSQQVVQSNVDQAIATKGGEGGHVEKTTSGKSSQTIAQLEERVAVLEGKVVAAKAAFSNASKEYQLHFLDGSLSISDPLLEAFTKAEEELLTLEAEMATECDDLAVKLGDQLQGANDKASGEREGIQFKMEIYHNKSEILNEGINTRMRMFADEFYVIRDALWGHFGPLEPVMNARMGQFATKVADVKGKLWQSGSTSRSARLEAAVLAANDEEGRIITGLFDVLSGLLRFKRVGEILQNILVKTNEKLWKLKSSAQRHSIQAHEARWSADTGTPDDTWTPVFGNNRQMTAVFLAAQADDFEEWSNKSQTEFDRQFPLAEQFMADVDGKLNETIQGLRDTFVTSLGYGQDLKASRNKVINGEYFVLSLLHDKLRTNLFTAAEVRRDLVITQTSAAQSIAQWKVDELDCQLTAAVKSTSFDVANTAMIIQAQIDEAKVELESAEEKAQEALDQAKQLADDFAEYTWLVGAGEDELSTKLVNLLWDALRISEAGVKVVVGVGGARLTA